MKTLISFERYSVSLLSFFGGHRLEKKFLACLRIAGIILLGHTASVGEILGGGIGLTFNGLIRASETSQEYDVTVTWAYRFQSRMVIGGKGEIGPGLSTGITDPGGAPLPGQTFGGGALGILSDESITADINGERRNWEIPKITAVGPEIVDVSGSNRGRLYRSLGPNSAQPTFIYLQMGVSLSYALNTFDQDTTSPGYVPDSGLIAYTRVDWPDSVETPPAPPAPPADGSGTGGAPEISIKVVSGRSLFDNGTYVMPATKQGKKSSIKVISITNEGLGPLTVNWPTISGQGRKNFKLGILFNRKPPQILNPGEVFYFDVQFRPRTKGVSKAVIQVESSTISSTLFQINLKGTGK